MFRKQACFDSPIILASRAIFPYQFPRLARDLAALAPDIVLTEIHLESYPALNPNRLWVPLFYPPFLTLRFCSSIRSPWFQSWRMMLTPTHSSSFSPSSLSRAIFPATSIFRPIYDESPRFDRGPLRGAFRMGEMDTASSFAPWGSRSTS